MNDVAFNDPLQWIIIGVIVFVVLLAIVFYYLGKARGQVKGMEVSSRARLQRDSMTADV